MSSVVRGALARTNLLGPAQRIRHLFPIGSGSFRSQRAALARFREQIGDSFLQPLGAGRPGGTALVFGLDTVTGAALHSVVVASFRAAGYRPVVVLPARSFVLEQAYRMLGVESFIFLEEFTATRAKADALRLLDGIEVQDDLMELAVDDCRVGRAALSTMMRRLRLGHLDLKDQKLRQLVASELADSIAAAKIGAEVLQRVQPRVVVFIDRGYTPTAQFFDLALARKLPVFTWNAGHRNNILMLKRYSDANRDDHPFSLSPVSWEKLKHMEWSSAQWARVRDELESCYRTGQWFSEVGTQANKSVMTASTLRQRLGFGHGRKTAAIFPHIFWDATFFWGSDLFASYEEWFVETVRCAVENPQLNWLIKIHPANLVKDRRDGYAGEHSETAALRRISSTLPPHIRVIPPDTDISTFDLFGLIDYCITVRGTVGMEAACFGIPAVTAGTGRYDHLGFTVDPVSSHEYRQTLLRLQDLPSMSEEGIELARRFAYGALIGRPLSLDTIQMNYESDHVATLNVTFRRRTPKELSVAPDITSLAAWIDADAEDYLDPAQFR